MTDYRPNFSRAIFFIILMVVAGLAACVPAAAPENGVSVQAALPTPTLEPTFTPTPTDTPPPEPASTLAPRAGLSGRILDQETNQPITEAQVSVGDLTTTTNANGRYNLTGLPPGQYILSVIHPEYDPGLSSILTLAGGQELSMDLTLYALDTSPYPKDPMLTNPLDPNGAPTAEDAERLARLQGLTGQVASIEETKLRGEFLVNYKIGEEIRAAVTELNHDVWELTDQAGRTWWIIKVCGNLASLLPQEAPIATPAPRPLPPMAEVLTDGLVVRTCASEDCAEAGSVTIGTLVEVFGCLADGGWCEVGWSGRRGWCTGQSLRQLAVAEAVPVVEIAVNSSSDCEEFKPGIYTQSMENLIQVIVAGKPDYRNGAMAPLSVCSSPQPRKLTITIESAISEAGTPLVEPPRFYLFRSLVWAIPDYIHSHNYVYANVEHDYTINEGSSLEGVITPGLYLLVFEHDSYDDLINPREAKDIPQSVTYRVELVDIP